MDVDGVKLLKEFAPGLIKSGRVDFGSVEFAPVQGEYRIDETSAKSFLTRFGLFTVARSRAKAGLRIE